MKEIELHFGEEPEESIEETVSDEIVINTEKKVTFSPEEEKTINDFSEKIDLTNTNIVLQYGAGAQKKITNFSEKTLEGIKTEELGEIGDLLSNVVTELKSIDEKEEQGILGLWKKQTQKVEKVRTKYRSAEGNVQKIVKVLEGHQIQLLKDVAMMDELYELNEQYFKELSMYIEAGERKLQRSRTTELVQLQEKARQSNLPMDAQKANDMAAMINRFEKKLHDLDLTRMVSLQIAPQIRMVQTGNAIMAEKIQTTITNTIPLWKNQMVLTLGMHHTQKAIEAQNEITEMTNKLFRQNAETLKSNTIEAARASERGIVDLETIKYTNEQLITAFEEVRQIQIEGSKSRAEAKAQLRQLEVELKNRLMNNSKDANEEKE